jgi:hypothetical protein
VKRADGPMRPSGAQTPTSRALWLAALCLPATCLAVGLLLTADVARAQQHEYVGVKRCKTCHRKEAIGDQYGVWLESRHAKAYETLAGEQAAKWGAEAGVDDPQNDEKCFKCHVTAFGAPAELVPARFDRTAGVQCEACHGPGKDYRKKKIMMDQEVAFSKGLVPQSEKVCLTCHNDESPAWNPEKYTRSDGTKTGFDYAQAVEKIAHRVPEGYDAAGEGGAD